MAQTKQKKKQTDWEAIERKYRAGVLSLREIGKQHSVSDTAIRKKAKIEGWERDLTTRVQAQVRAKLVRAEVRSVERANPQTEHEIVEEAAATVVEVVRSHRKGIAAGRNIVGMLMQQLTSAAENREVLEDIIEDETKEDTTTKRRTALMKAVSLPAHAATIRDLSTAMKNVVSLERQAFNIRDELPPPTDDLTDDELDREIAQLKKEISASAG